MDRKEFLKYVGLGVLALVGLGSLLRFSFSSEDQAQPDIGGDDGTYGGGRVQTQASGRSSRIAA